MGANDRWTIADAEATYHIADWGEGYFAVNDRGNLCVRPNKTEHGPSIEIKQIVDEMKLQGIPLPGVIRFHDILRSQVIKINQTFRQMIEEAQFQGSYYGVYPIKVNQMREVVEEILDVGGPYNYGLEAGSKPELLAVLAMNNNQRALTILNGYKDDDYLRLACAGIHMGRQVIVVVEKYSELLDTIRIAQEQDVRPLIGFRAKLSTQGSGRWRESGGEKAKFGLTIPEIMNGVEHLKSINMLDCLKLFHFHIGSQIPDIKTIKDALTEAAHIYAGLRKLGAPIEYFDVGGGAGVDYEGTHTRRDSSRNYDLKDYVADVVYIIKQVCDLEKVPHPNLVSETGRAVVAQHSCIILNIFGSVVPQLSINFEVTSQDHFLLQQMKDLMDSLLEPNFQEVYNDAVSKKEEAINAFKLGYLSLTDRAKIETLYLNICQKVKSLADAYFEGEQVPEEIASLQQKLAPQYLANFSVFQSLPDSWAIDQVMPVAPITGLDKAPTVWCSLADITCDSDGKIDQFVTKGGILSTLPLHELKKGEEYLIGVFLTGAYQDIMGDMHNLFGRVNEVHVFCDDEDPTDFYIEEVIRGHRSRDVLATLQYSPEVMAQSVKKCIDRQVQQGKIRPREGVRLADFYEKCLSDYTYLKTSEQTTGPV